MCGLSGAISDYLSQVEIEMFRHLMLVSTLRGQYGAGIVCVPQKHSKDIKTHRSLDMASEVAYSADFSDLLKYSKQKPSVLMGHARSPTTGGYELDDSHPHICDNIVGMHNGTLTHVTGKKVGKDDNDSKLLFQSIADNGIDKAIKDTKGSYALVWIDRNTSQIHFLRNEGRTLFFAWAVGKMSTLWWSSEDDMLRFVLSRGLDEQIAVAALKPDRLVSYKIRPQGGKMSPLSYRALNAVPTARFETALVNQAQQIDLDTGVPDKFQDNVHVHTFAGETITISELRVILGGVGCSYCNEVAPMSAYINNELYWFAKHEFVCAKCYQSDPLAQNYVLSHTKQPI